MNTRKDKNRNKTEILLSIGFTGLMFALSWSSVVYIPISDERIIDLSLVPIIFVAMIGGYKIAIPVAIGWWLSATFNQLGNVYTWEWIFIYKMTFTISLVYFYDLFRKAYPYSPWNVYRTVIAAVVIKNLISAVGMMFMYSQVAPGIWVKNLAVEFTIELAICLLAMSLIIEKLRKIHILNGVRRKERALNKRNENRRNENKINRPAMKEN
jgi:hypothetical protein